MNAKTILYRIEHPNRRTVRTVFQAFVALCAAAPILVSKTGLDQSQLPWLATVLAGAAIVTRAMNTPKVEALLSHYFPWLAAQPPASTPVAPEPPVSSSSPGDPAGPTD